jgi:transcriptional regulator with XRE-family HTH domain
MATAMSTRTDELRAFKKEVGTIDVKVDAEFQRALRTAQELLEMSDQEIGDALSVSHPTVNRWINGTNLPYNAMRKVVLSWIYEKLAAKVRTIEGFRPHSMTAQLSNIAPRIF